MKTLQSLLFTALFALGCVFTASAGGFEQPIAFDSLPKPAQEFCRTHFKDLTLAYVVKDTKIMTVEYEVKYIDRTEVDFRADGSWESVERKYAPVPAAIVPKQISAYVASNPHLTQQFIKKIERSPYHCEIELASGLEITFDPTFNVIGYDD